MKEIIIFVLVLVSCGFIFSRINKEPLSVPYLDSSGNIQKQDKAPWIREKTPVPSTLTASIKEDPVLKQSVDPGAHIECQNYCEKKGMPEKNKELFMNTCINICIQQKWTKPDSPIKQYVP